jgi:hypothetical protein
MIEGAYLWLKGSIITAKGHKKIFYQRVRRILEVEKGQGWIWEGGWGLRVGICHLSTMIKSYYAL